ncbi:hypothetical protein LJR013_003843 [Pseudarthrobacter oxydans]|uniref:Type IV secretory pathway TrbL component n=1 Tax=Pseudarthrobacter oxydans TaxID=1671 RepID=A0AAW8N6I0_PSEOX|nr:hypothetical protein [Pseudarthrobacter oxydans]MBA4101387.1 hypothetical protein [Arthrobacter sp.]MDR6791897.1 type IV secretory pathway TrbL component [Pseudarthrobacter oxydans]MDR7163312.1 type IV secretory pathway TrbL component [Pseudarthrobacter oxydans]
MKNKLLLGVGIAAGYVLGSRSGRAAYDKLKARAAGIWDSKPVQDKVAVATETIKEKAPEVADQLSEAARRAGTVIGSAMHREGASGEKKSPTSDDAATTGANGTSAAGTSGGFGTAGTTGTRSAGTPGGDDLGEGHIPAHSTHPETHNLGTSDETDSKS